MAVRLCRGEGAACVRMDGLGDRPGSAPRLLRDRDLRERVTHSAGRVAMTAEEIEALSGSLGPSDRPGGDGGLKRGLGGRAAARAPSQRVVVMSLEDTGIAQARAKTDKLDSRTLASLLWRGELEAVWAPDEHCGCSAGGFIVASSSCARTRAKHEVHAVRMRTLHNAMRDARALRPSPPSSATSGKNSSSAPTSSTSSTTVS